MLQTVPTARRLALLAVAIGLVSAPALAAGPGDAAMRRWKVQDTCVADATKKEPDHTAAALHRRDDLVNTCLKAHGMPPIDGVAPPSPDTPPAAPAANPPK
jgi:citrate lyase beta subunit